MLKHVVPVVGIMLVGTTATAGALATTKIWKGSEGQLVEIGSLAQTSHALVRVRQSGTDFDGIILDCAVEEQGARRVYVTRHLGTRWELLRLEDGRGTLFVGGRADVSLKFSEDVSATPSTGEKLIADHAEQVRTGAIALFERKAFPHLEAKYQSEADAELRSACGGTLHLAYAWGSFSDDVMENVDVWSLCRPLVSQVKASCAALKGVTSLVCKLGSELAVDRVSNTLAFTTTRDGAKSAASFLSSHVRK